MKLICIGDSLTFGYGVHLSQRWTRLCAQETGWELVNEGINGDTTGGMLARMQGGVLAELREGGLGADRPYVLLMGGSNDVFYSGSDAAARGNMGAMIHQLFSVGVCRWLAFRFRRMHRMRRGRGRPRSILKRRSER